MASRSTRGSGERCGCASKIGTVGRSSLAMPEYADNAAGPAPAGSLEAQYAALIRGAGICLLPSRIVVRVIGDDRASFIHGMCSADIRAAQTGSVLAALFLTEHAHLIADFFAWICEDSIRIDIDAQAWERARAHLEKLLVADDVEFEDEPDIAVLHIEGPRALEAMLAATHASDPGAARWVRKDGMFIGNVDRFGKPGFTLLVDRNQVDSLAVAVESLGADFRRVGFDALDTVRIENGLARVGVDTNERTLALEARLERAISFSKGCYVGQETIERATARGGLKKKLFGLRFQPGRLPRIGAMVKLDGKEVGRLGSATDSPRLGPIGLAILHHDAWKPGTAVMVIDESGETPARVTDIPFH